MTHKKMSNEGDHDEASDNHRRGGGGGGRGGEKVYSWSVHFHVVDVELVQIP